MGKSRMIKYVVHEQLNIDHMPSVRWKFTGPCKWDHKYLGKPTSEKLGQWVMDGNKSYLPGGINEHVSNAMGVVPYCYAAKVVNQYTGETVAEWRAPLFQVM